MTKEALCSVLETTGSTWVTLRQLQKAKVDLAGMDDLINSGEIFFMDKDLPKNQLHEDLFTTKEIYIAECEIAMNVARINAARPRAMDPDLVDQAIDKHQKEVGFTLCDEQRNAVYTAINNQFCIITGGPGTGKTSVLRVATLCMNDFGYTDVSYTAPTGKAASRISESTGSPAITLHKKLHLNPDDPNPCMVENQVLIVDEVSMLDLPTARALMRSIPSGTKLIMLGDTDQLPSVGIGAILRDLIASGVVPVAKLVKTFRQSGDSGIFKNMKIIRNGIVEKDANGKEVFPLSSTPDFKIVHPSKNWPALKEIEYLYMKEYKRLGGCEQIVVLTPYRNEKFQTSSDYLNKVIQKLVNPDSPGLIVGKTAFRVNDPVMQLVNREECANGDVGKVTHVTASSITVEFTDTIVTYSAEDLLTGQLTLAYCMSIHKSQGSEYKSVITILLKENEPMLQRNLLYTAITRAKKQCFLVCEDEAVITAVKTEASSGRITMLTQRLREYSERQTLLG